MKTWATKNLYIYSSTGMHWFRYYGKGLCLDNKPLNFSERNGYKKYLPIFGMWKITMLHSEKY